MVFGHERYKNLSEDVENILDDYRKRSAKWEIALDYNYKKLLQFEKLWFLRSDCLRDIFVLCLCLKSSLLTNKKYEKNNNNWFAGFGVSFKKYKKVSNLATRKLHFLKNMKFFQGRFFHFSSMESFLLKYKKRMTLERFKSSKQSTSYKFFVIFSLYSKMNKNLSAKYFQENRERLEKQPRERQ